MLAATSRAEERQVKNTLLSSDVVTICKAHKPLLDTSCTEPIWVRELALKHQVAQASNEEQKAMASICIVCVQC